MAASASSFARTAAGVDLLVRFLRVEDPSGLGDTPTKHEPGMEGSV